MELNKVQMGSVGLIVCSFLGAVLCLIWGASLQLVATFVVFTVLGAAALMLEE